MKRIIMPAVAVALVAGGFGVSQAMADAPTNACDSVYNANTIKGLKVYDDCRFDRLEKAISALTPTSPSPTTASPSSTLSPTGTTLTNVFVTGYTYWDNTPPGSAAISNPVLHRTAGGTGTYADPTTLAVGHSLATGNDVLDYPAGTRFYLPAFQKYAIVEDTCGDGPTPQNNPCHNVSRAPSGTKVWIDLWFDGRSLSSSAADACTDRNTLDNATVIRDPAVNLPVKAGTVC